MAVAALVLGILSFFCFGPLVGVPAVVFGLLGLSKAKEVGSGKGMSIAGIILGTIGSIAIVVGFIALVLAADDVTDDLSGAADGDDYELTTDTCEIDEFGFVTFEGTIENTAGRNMNFIIEGEIRDADTDVLLDDSTTYVEIREDDTIRWSIPASVGDPTDITCQVVGVDNFLN
jgi:hypothetical protein